MYGVDYEIHGITVEHRRSLLTLLKVQFHDFEPCYAKIPSHAVHAPSSSSSKIIQDPSFGMFSLLAKDKVDLDKMFFGEEPVSPSMLIEIYHDRQELDLICAGKLPTITLKKINSSDDLVLKGDRLMQASSAFQLFAHTRLQLALRHKCQGKFSMDAGFIDISVKLYHIDTNKVHDNSYKLDAQTTQPVTAQASHTCNSSFCKICQEAKPQTIQLEFPRLQRAPIFISPQQPSNQHEEVDQEAVSIAEEEEESYRIEDDYDSVDEFVNKFNQLHTDQKYDDDDDNMVMIPEIRQATTNSQVQRVSFQSATNTSVHSKLNQTRSKNQKPKTTMKKKKPAYLAPYAMSLGSTRR